MSFFFITVNYIKYNQKELVDTYNFVMDINRLDTNVNWVHAYKRA